MERIPQARAIMQGLRAAGLSLAVMAASILVQGGMFFRTDLMGIFQTNKYRFLALSNIENQRTSLVAVRFMKSDVEHSLNEALGNLDITTNPPSVHVFQSDALPRENLRFCDARRNGQAALLVADSRRVWMVDSVGSTNELFSLASDIEGTITDIAWARNGTVFVVVEDERDGRQMAAIDSSTKKENWRKNDLHAMSLAVHPSRQELICGLGSGEIVRIASANGNELLVGGNPGSAILGLCVSPDGRHFASIDINARVRVYDFETVSELWTIQSSLPNCQPRFSTDGRAIIVGHLDNTSVATFETRSGKRLSEMKGNAVAVQSFLPVSPELIYVVDCDGGLTPWNWKTHVLGARVSPELRPGSRFDAPVVATNWNL